MNHPYPYKYVMPSTAEPTFADESPTSAFHWPFGPYNGSELGVSCGELSEGQLQIVKHIGDGRLTITEYKFFPQPNFQVTALVSISLATTSATVRYDMWP